MNKFRQQYLDTIMLGVGGAIAIGIIITIIGRTFISVYEGGDPDRLDRPELWIGISILLGVILVMSLLSRQPADKGFLGKDVAIGDVGIWDDELPPVDPRVTHGPIGTYADINVGYTVYAGSGQLATVVGLLPGGVDYGRRFSGMIYAQGVKSAAKELWIPYEAVTAVYPESKSVFLAIQGDETEFLGWTSPPEGMTRGSQKPVRAEDQVK